MRLLYINSLLVITTLGLTHCKPPDPLIKLKSTSYATQRADKKAKKPNHKAAKRKWKEDRKTKILTDKAVKEHHKKLQTKNTLKSMKENRKKSRKMRGYQ